MAAENKEKEITEEINGETSTENQETASQTHIEGNKEEGAEFGKVQQELAEMKDKYLRLYSEFENFRRRTSKEKIELIGSANEQLMVSLLPVIDDMERSKQSLETATDVTALKEGIDLVFNKFFKTLESKGLKPLDSKGKEFNADIHEAITQIPAPSDDLKGKIVDEIEKGYYLNEKLIRVAKVVIGA